MRKKILEILKEGKKYGYNNEAIAYELLILHSVSKPLIPEGVTINSATSKEGFNFTDYEYREWLKSDIDNLDDFLEQELC